MNFCSYRRRALPALLCFALSGFIPAVADPSLQAGFSPEGSALQLVLQTIDTAQLSIRLMGYTFTSPAVVKSLIAARRRGVDVKVVLDEKGNRGKASQAAMNLLVNADIPVRTVNRFRIMHDKVIVTDGRNTELGSFNFTASGARANSENVLIVRDDIQVAQTYLRHWQSRWEMGADWHSPY
ncbi:phospholipase D family nuclease [Cedecea sp. NFIX57]|jgi:phosphatidylserine/phosphatidylglycerophosphate/cardiolipin synthase-like enzyme|uniref:phospholipase D family nuclease n=1 Tax=Cedecea sp. NFIX57 TaxID=1566286 RepID=UPI000A0DDB4A|nr:phospholipase D family protein [Cedecea sp. NFIX57]SMG59923.1 PLD-like domain-containing protein [Cedecea sp. NFIX57]